MSEITASGPWIVEKADIEADVSYVRIWSGIRDAIAKRGGEMWAVVQVNKCALSDEEIKRLVYLVSAAPDLYEACAAYYYGRKDARECEQMMGDALRKAVTQ